MPSYQDHLVFGSFLVLVFSVVARPFLSYSWEAVLVSAAVILLASVVPDVDHRGSVVHKKVRALAALLVATVPAVLAFPAPPAMVLGAGLAGMGTYVLFGLLKPRHRTITHTVRACIAFATLVGLFSLVAVESFLPGVFAFVAYFSHLLLDRTLAF